MTGKMDILVENEARGLNKDIFLQSGIGLYRCTDCRIIAEVVEDLVS